MEHSLSVEHNLIATKITNFLCWSLLFSENNSFLTHSVSFGNIYVKVVDNEEMLPC